jgi:hypothetical protein
MMVMTEEDTENDHVAAQRTAIADSTEEVAWHVETYYSALMRRRLPEPLVRALVLDYHRAMLGPKERRYMLEYSDYGEYLEAWERKTFGARMKGATDDGRD